MNILIIIGNGFDLAHGLKTSYKDFMLDYLVSGLELVNSEGRYEDDVVNINTINSTHFSRISEIIKWIKNDVNALKSLLNNEKYIFNSGGINRFLNNLNITFKNSFIERLFKSSAEKWVDIEEFYYRQLLELVRKGRIDEEIDALNAGILFLRNRLEEYLSRIEAIEVDPIQTLRFVKLCLENYYCNSNESITNIETVLFLNFNYTVTLYHYCQEFNLQGDNINVKYIDIHGTIKNKENPIILGYGDEMDSNYQILQETNNNKLLDYAKSFVDQSHHFRLFANNFYRSRFRL